MFLGFEKMAHRSFHQTQLDKFQNNKEQSIELCFWWKVIDESDNETINEIINLMRNNALITHVRVNPNFLETSTGLQRRALFEAMKTLPNTHLLVT